METIGIKFRESSIPVEVEPQICRKSLNQGIPIGSYPTPFLMYLLFYIREPNHKTRYPKKGGRV